MVCQPCSTGAPAPAESTNPPSRNAAIQPRGGGRGSQPLWQEKSNFLNFPSEISGLRASCDGERPGRCQQALDAFRCAIGSCVVDRTALCAAKTPGTRPRALVGRVRVPAVPFGHARARNALRPSCERAMLSVAAASLWPLGSAPPVGKPIGDQDAFRQFAGANARCRPSAARLMTNAYDKPTCLRENLARSRTCGDQVVTLTDGHRRRRQ